MRVVDFGEVIVFGRVCDGALVAFGSSSSKVAVSFSAGGSVSDILCQRGEAKSASSSTPFGNRVGPDT